MHAGYDEVNFALDAGPLLLSFRFNFVATAISTALSPIPAPWKTRRDGKNGMGPTALFLARIVAAKVVQVLSRLATSTTGNNRV